MNTVETEILSLQLEMAGSTDTGLVRQRNEDSIAMNPEQGIAVLSDGMGGHLGGDVASRMAVEIIGEELCKEWDAADKFSYADEHLIHAVQKANRKIRAAAKNQPELSGMGATVVVLAVSDKILISHLGDSRAYLFNDNRLTRLTEDHTLAQQYLNQGVLDENEARTWAGRNLLIKGLGIEQEVAPEIVTSPLNGDHLYLLCSDGLTDAAADDQISQTMSEILKDSPSDLQACADRLIDLANEYGGPDNTSVILVRAKAPVSETDTS